MMFTCGFSTVFGNYQDNEKAVEVELTQDDAQALKGTRGRGCITVIVRGSGSLSSKSSAKISLYGISSKCRYAPQGRMTFHNLIPGEYGAFGYIKSNGRTYSGFKGTHLPPFAHKKITISITDRRLQRY